MSGVISYTLIGLGLVGLLQGVAWIGGYGAKSLPNARTRRWAGAWLAPAGLVIFALGFVLLRVPNLFSGGHLENQVGDRDNRRQAK